jgi:hypothetical protein
LAQADFLKYVDPDFMDTYTETMASIFQLAYPNIDEETAAGLAAAVSAFETDISTIIIKLIEAMAANDVDPYVSVTRGPPLLMRRTTDILFQI